MKFTIEKTLSPIDRKSKQIACKDFHPQQCPMILWCISWISVEVKINWHGLSEDYLPQWSTMILCWRFHFKFPASLQIYFNCIVSPRRVLVRNNDCCIPMSPDKSNVKTEKVDVGNDEIVLENAWRVTNGRKMDDSAVIGSGLHSRILSCPAVSEHVNCQITLVLGKASDYTEVEPLMNCEKMSGWDETNPKNDVIDRKWVVDNKKDFNGKIINCRHDQSSWTLAHWWS